MKRLARAIYARLPFKRQAYIFLRQWLGITPPFFQHLHFTGPFEAPIDTGQSLKLFSAGNVVENELFWLGFGQGWEGTSLQLWRRMCRGSDGLILDIGANSGIYALVAAAVAPSAEVIAFEPITRVAAHLRRNVALNEFPIRIEQSAVSNRDGTTTIFDVIGAFNYSASLEGQGPSASAVEVPVCSIDTLFADRTRPVITIKIDIERHEPAAIAGMLQTLERDRPAVLVEILDREIGAAVERQISGLGYRIFHVAEGKGLLPAARLEPLGDHDWNHLLCTEEQFERFGLADFLVTHAGPSNSAS